MSLSLIFVNDILNLIFGQRYFKRFLVNDSLKGYSVDDSLMVIFVKDSLKGFLVNDGFQRIFGQ